MLFDDGQHGAAQKFFHYVVQLVVVQLMDGRKPLGDDLAVAAVRAEGIVAVVQAIRLADRRCLLTDGEVRGAGVVVVDAIVRVLGLDFVEHELKLADGAHVVVDAHEIVLGIKRLLILADRDILEADKSGLECLIGHYGLSLRHCKSPMQLNSMFHIGERGYVRGDDPPAPLRTDKTIIKTVVL